MPGPKLQDPRIRFWARVDKNGPVPTDRPDLGRCWVWTGHVLPVGGYGTLGVKEGDVWKTRLAHRLVYMWMVGEIPDRYDIDHLCRTRRCVNPSHLEAVTRRENLLRGNSTVALNAAKTHCKRGHEFSDENTIWHVKRTRECATCRSARINDAARQIRHRAWEMAAEMAG